MTLNFAWIYHATSGGADGFFRFVRELLRGYELGRTDSFWQPDEVFRMSF